MLVAIIPREHINNRRMAKKTQTIRVRTSFVVDILDKIIKEEEVKGRDDTSYSTASKILRERILAVGWKK